VHGGCGDDKDHTTSPIESDYCCYTTNNLPIEWTEGHTDIFYGKSHSLCSPWNLILFMLVSCRYHIVTHPCPWLFWTWQRWAKICNPSAAMRLSNKQSLMLIEISYVHHRFMEDRLCSALQFVTTQCDLRALDSTDSDYYCQSTELDSSLFYIINWICIYLLPFCLHSILTTISPLKAINIVSPGSLLLGSQ